MITIILFSILGAYLGFDLSYHITIIPKEFMDYALMTLFTFCFGVLGGLLGSLISSLLPAKFEEVITTYRIISLQDSNNIHGEISGGFLAFSGYVDGTMVYNFYYENDGGYRLKQIESLDTLVKYTTEMPYCVEYKLKLTNNFINKYVTSDKVGDCRYILYVAQGCIKNEFTLDSK